MSTNRTPARRIYRIATAMVTALSIMSLAACSSGGDDGSGGDVGADVSAPILDGLTGDEHDRVAGLIAEAQGESNLTWIDSVVAPETATALVDEFKKQYNLDFTLNYERLTSGDLSTRIQQEVTAGQVNTDFFGVASPTLFATLKDADALTQYESPESAAYADSAKYVSQQPGYWIAPVAYSFGVIVNPELYPEPITSWKQLSDPALAGKWDVPNVAANEGSLLWFYGLSNALPESTFEEWAANSPSTSTGSSAQEAQKVAEGQVDLAITSGFRASQTVEQTGVDLKVYYPDEGTVLNGQTYAIPAGAPDLAIAKLFDDFVLSKDGLQMYVDREGIASLRDDVVQPDAAVPFQPAVADMVALPVNTDEISREELDAARDTWKRIFGR